MSEECQFSETDADVGPELLVNKEAPLSLATRAILSQTHRALILTSSVASILST